MKPDDILLTLMADPSAIADPYPLYRQLRETAPLFRTQASGTWVISGFENARNLLRDPRCGSPPDQGSVGPVSIDGSPRREFDRDTVSMLFLNPPDHTRIRGLVSRAFTPRRVERLRPEVTAMTDELLDELGGSGDFVDSVAFPLPANVISALVGVPQADRDWLRPLIADLSASLEPVSSSEELDRAEAAALQTRAYLADLIKIRRADPQDDLLTGLIQASDGEDRLSGSEVISNVLLIYAAGFETTTQLLSNMVRALVAHPDQLQSLRNDLSLIPAAVEEVLRYDPPVQVDGRYLFADIEVGEITIPAGSTTLMLLAAANRDPYVCTEPDRFDITRGDTHLLSFGSGIHFCLGAALARLEGQVVLERLLSRYQSWAVTEEVWRHRITIRGVERLAVEFQ